MLVVCYPNVSLIYVQVLPESICVGVTWIYVLKYVSVVCYLNVFLIYVQVLPGSICVGVT